MLKRLFFLALLGLAVAPPPQIHLGQPQDPLAVSTTSGQIHGKIDPSTPAVRQFLGIPYAHPPVGERRWTAPQLLNQPGAHVQATQLPASCMQYLSSPGGSVYTRDALEFNLQGLNKTGAISEDCLTLSIWTPPDAAAKDSRRRSDRGQYGEGLPVLIFFYGGAYVTGGQDVPYQIPAQWVQRSQKHVVISFNYRVNIFGFPNGAGVEDQNLGFLDQRAVVEWAQKNIAAFGGDPNRMIIWGQSAGSGSVDMYNFAYPDDPIVKGLIMDSGTAKSEYFGTTPLVITDDKHTNFTFVAENVGCAGLSGDAAAQLQCMRGVDAAEIENFVGEYQQNGTLPSIAFTPVLDHKVVFANYTERALEGLQADVPAIIGTNAQEGVPFAPYDSNGPNQAIVDFAHLTTFFCPATESSRLRQRTGRTTYRYTYGGNFSNIAPESWMGAYHASELPLIMGTHSNYRGPSTPLEYATSEAMQDAYLAFASDPENGLAKQNWKQYDTLGSNNVREFGAGVAAQDTSLASDEAKCDGNVPTWFSDFT